MRILIIEDNPGDVRLVRERLKEAPTDFRMTDAERLASGLVLLESQPFDILLLDMGLPDSQGLDGLAAVQKRFPHLPVVILTSADDEGLGVQAVQLGAQDYLPKAQLDGRLLHRALHYAMERKKTDVALKDAEAKARALIEHAPAGICEIDLTDLHFVSLNDAMCRASGYSREELLARGPAGLVSDAALEPFLDRIRQALAGGSGASTMEFEFRKKDGSMAQVVASITRSPDRPHTLLIIGRDISENKRLENGLRESQRKYRALVETTGEFIWETDASGRYTYCSPQMQRLWGYEPEQRLGTTPFDIMPPEDREPALQFLQSMAKSPQPFRIESRAYNAAGDVIFLETSGVPFFDERGELQGYRGTSRDTTDRRKMEEALRESEAQAQALIRYAPTAIFELDYRGSRFISANDAVCIISGYSREEIMSMNPMDLLADESKAIFADRIRRQLAGEKIPEMVEYRVRTKDGSIIYATLNTSFSPRRLNTALVIAHDITQRRKMEEALRDSETRFRVLAEAMPQIVWSTDSAGRVDYLNRRGQEYRGIDPAQTQGAESWPAVHPDDAEHTRAAWRQSMETGETYAVEQRLRRADGEYRWHLTRAVPIQDDLGQTARWIGTSTDVHDERMAERAHSAILETVQSGYFMCDLEGKILEVNDAWSRMTGYSRDELLRMHVQDLEDCETSEEVLRHIQFVRRSGHHQFESRHRRRDGTVFDVDIRSTNVGKGRVVGFAWDISDRKSAEERIGRQIAITEAIHQVLKEAIASASEEALGRTCLLAVEELTGSRLGFLGEVNDEGLLDDIAVSHPDRSACSTDSPAGHGRVWLQDRAVRGLYGPVIRDGKAFFTNDPASHPESAGMPPRTPKLTAFLGVPLLHGSKVVGMMGLANREGGYRPEDLEAAEALAPVIVEALTRKRAEIALRENEGRLRVSEERYRALFESISDGFCVIEKVSTAPGEPSDFEYVTGNQAYQQITGISTPVGRTIRQVFPLVPRQVFDGYDRLIETGSPFRFESNRAIEGRIFENHAFLVPDGTGRRIGVIIRDVTERREAEENLQRYADRLEAVNKDMEAFSYSLSHDLKAPLRTLDGFSEALLAEYGDKLDQAGTDQLRRIRRASRTMSDLIDGMLKLSQIGLAELMRERVDLSRMAQSICDELQAAHPERRFELALAHGMVVLGDRQLLGILLRNLLENAWKFTRKSEAARIEVGVTLVGGERAYFVKDNGVGFDMKHAGKLFDPFRRLHPAREFPGTGIGLATARRIVRNHGGRIWAESEPGRGATFYFVLGS